MDDDKKQKACCPHCEEELLCEQCGGKLVPTKLGLENEVAKPMGYLCPACMQRYSDMVSEVHAPKDTNYPMDN